MSCAATRRGTSRSHGRTIRRESLRNALCGGSKTSRTRIQYGGGRQKLLQRLTANPELGTALTEAAKTLVAVMKDESGKDSE